MAERKVDLLQGTLDLLIMKALALEPMHGFGLSVRLRQLTRDVFQFEMGSLYPALCRLEERGWLKGTWGTSGANRRARYYSLTAAGRRQLEAEISRWDLISGTINTVLRST